jgi:hypothetical protein
MALTVTLPIASPTNLQATLQAGGSLAANTTYYYIVIAYDQTSYTPSGVFCYHSPISIEGTFTTDTTNRSVKINWDNVTGATRYQILLTTISGNYTNSGGYGTAAENVGSITSGVTGYTITSLSSEIYVFHTCQIVNTLPGNLNKNLGLIKVDFATAGNITLDQVYDAIVAQGFGDYVVYDGYNFILKGWFYAPNNSSTGLFNPTRKRFSFVKGGVINDSSTYTFRFGTWTSDAVGANYTNGCAIDILNARTPFRGPSNYGTLQVYGSLVTNGQSMYLKLAENKTIGNFLFGSPYIGYTYTEIKDNIMGIAGRGVTSDVIDLKWWQQNNFGNGKHVRLKIYVVALLPYSTAPGGFYNCDFLTNTKLSRYSGHGGGYDLSGYNCKFYDCKFTGFTSKMLDKDNYSMSSIENPYLWTNQFDQIYYSLSATVLDENGNPLQDVSVNAIKQDGNPVIWVEHDNSTNRYVTGNTYTTDRKTDVNGQIDYYIRRHKLSHDPSNNQYPTSTMIIQEDDFPFTITFSKEGYRNYTVLLQELNERTNLTLTLEDYEYPVFMDRSISGSIDFPAVSGEVSFPQVSGNIESTFFVEGDI